MTTGMRDELMAIARVVLFVAGAVLFAVLLIEVGPAQVAASFSELSWWLLVILWFPFIFINAFDTLGWKYAFRQDRLSFRTLLWARLAGEAVNATTPTASVGGDAVKAWVIRRHVPLDEGLPSVIIAKTTITIAQALFLVLGIGVAWLTFPGNSPFLRAMEILLVLEVLGVGGFVLVQTVGVLGGAAQILRRLGLFTTDKTPSALDRVDDGLSRFYRDHPDRLILSVAAHFGGWVLSALEAYVILYALGLPVSVTTAILIEAFGTGIRFASFMVPAHLGALEGGHIAIFVALGFTAPAGLTFSLVRRVRELAWTGVGFIALAALRSPALAPAAAEREA